MDARYYNGEPEAQHDPGRSDGTPIAYYCCVCGWRGKGAQANRDHWYATKHRPIVTGDDPRYGQAISESEVA